MPAIMTEIGQFCCIYLSYINQQVHFQNEYCFYPIYGQLRYNKLPIFLEISSVENCGKVEYV